MANRLTITEVAKRVGVTTKTIMRWEQAGKVRSPSRDWRGWRIYDEQDVALLQAFRETVYKVS